MKLDVIVSSEDKIVEFWGKVNKQGPYPKAKKALKRWSEIKGTRCYEWTGGLFYDGYGQFHLAKAHRVAYELHYGKGSLGKLRCLHKCDNKKCVNPLHLFKGTHRQNMKDMVVKGRSCKGEHIHTAKLTALQVRAIRSLYNLGGYSHRDLGKLFNVSKAMIRFIVNRTSWKHIK